MNHITLFLVCAIMGIVTLAFMAILSRFRVERQARAILALHPHAERLSVYLPLHSMWAWTKQREIDAKVSEMSVAGWTFLGAAAASPLRTICSLGGGVTLQFIRV